MCNELFCISMYIRAISLFDFVRLCGISFFNFMHLCAMSAFCVLDIGQNVHYNRVEVISMGTAVFDRKKLQSLLENLAVLSGMGVSFWHPEQDVCLATTSNVPSAYCARLQTSQAMSAECKKCEQLALRITRRGLKTQYFTCHAGLKECISPVIYNGEVLGFVMIGQVLFTEDNGTNIDPIREWIEENGFNFNEIRSLYLLLPRIGHEKQQALLKMISALASLVHIEGIVRRIELPLIARIEKYVDEHLNEPISLDDVVEALSVSRSTICHTLRTEKNCTFVKLVNQKRVDVVRKAIASGKTVAEAAEMAGFSSVSYCSRVFLQVTGSRPSTNSRNI